MERKMRKLWVTRLYRYSKTTFTLRPHFRTARLIAAPATMASHRQGLHVFRSLWGCDSHLPFRALESIGERLSLLKVCVCVRLMCVACGGALVWCMCVCVRVRVSLSFFSSSLSLRHFLPALPPYRPAHQRPAHLPLLPPSTPTTLFPQLKACGYDGVEASLADLGGCTAERRDVVDGTSHQCRVCWRVSSDSSSRCPCCRVLAMLLAADPAGPAAAAAAARRHSLHAATRCFGSLSC